MLSLYETPQGNSLLFLGFFPSRFNINPLDKTIEQRTRGYFIADSASEVKRYIIKLFWYFKG